MDKNLQHVISTACKPGVFQIAPFSSFPNIPHIPPPLGHSAGTNEATTAPTPENAACWHEITRPREICTGGAKGGWTIISIPTISSLALWGTIHAPRAPRATVTAGLPGGALPPPKKPPRRANPQVQYLCKHPSFPQRINQSAACQQSIPTCVGATRKGKTIQLATHSACASNSSPHAWVLNQTLQ